MNTQPYRLEELEELRDESKDVAEYRRSLVLIMHGRGFPAQEISEILGISRTAIYKLIQQFALRGQAAVKPGRKRGRPSTIKAEYLDRLRELLSRSPLEFGHSRERWTLEILRDQLARDTGHRLSLEHVRRLRLKLDLSI